MKNIKLKVASIKDKHIVVHFDYALDKIEHIKLKREEKITKAISMNECYLILNDITEVGFVIFDYRFFDQGWIELMVIDEKYRGLGIGPKAISLICDLSKTSKVFTSTNKSNIPMKKALDKAGFIFAGEILGLDEGDPEQFFYKKMKSENSK